MLMALNNATLFRLKAGGHIIPTKSTGNEVVQAALCDG
jgi:hypothetical protein